ncbi:hypothetical protein [Geobacter sulfurreducens]|uniref:hypothetical protein n=1 Tax=Geobacter sulfurreducens TaxID=35554 RepID=UPI000DBBA027|nr:hypothetical protein [Geobacter sulfurreducens]BBA70620.1 hypothetical protein YM18_2101 [Geobacter sulfurreducens]
MGRISKHVPFVWPDTIELTGQAQESCLVPYHFLTPDTSSIFGVVSGIDSEGALWLEHISNENPELHIKLVLALYGACATQTEDLERLFTLQQRYSGRVEFKIFATQLSYLAGTPSNILCFISRESLNTSIAIGPTANFGITEALEAQANLVFKADAPTVDSWRKWFELLWLKSSPLSESTAQIPHLVPARGTDEAEEMWRQYEVECQLAFKNALRSDIRIEVDPETGEVTAIDENGEEVEMPTKSLGVPRLDKVADRVSRLYGKGAMVTIDKGSRIPPLDAPIRAEWFGIKSSRQIGAVTREVKYRISVLDEKLLKDLENRRKSIRQIINAFSYPLAESVCWMPDSARKVMELELERVNKEGNELIGGVIGNDAEKFVKSQISRIIDDANKMYKDFNPNGELGKEVIDEIVSDLTERLQKAMNGRFLPQISYTEVSFSPNKDSETSSCWVQALSLMEAISRFPRELAVDPFKMRGIRINESEYAKVMDVCDDSIYQRRPYKDIINEELDFIKNILKEGFTAREKCELLLDIIDGKSKDDINHKIAEFVTKTANAKDSE